METIGEEMKKANAFLNKIDDVDLLLESIWKKSVPDYKKDSLPTENQASAEGQHQRLDTLEIETGKSLPRLSGRKPFADLKSLEGNIENYIGMTQVPTGVIGPVKVQGTAASGDYFVPLATSEGALVASYHRGAKATRLSGGITSICLVEGVQRSPVFKFNNVGELGQFLLWILNQEEQFKIITTQTSRFAKLNTLKSNIEGNQLILTFEYYTGDAAGQNMVTLCTDEICQYIIRNAPVQPQFWFLEGNYSGDKKATALSLSHVRGKKVVAEVTLPKEIVTSVLKTTPQAMDQYCRAAAMGVIQSGAIGAQGHFANGLTALFIATGQDVACVAEAAMGITRMELTSSGDLYACVTMPNLIVGTVGGGTSLPTQRECLELMECYGAGQARKFAEICGALVLAGEISIAAALSAGQFSAAHKKFGRKRS